MKKSRLVLLIIFAVLTSFLTFYTSQLFMAILVNYEALSITAFAPVTMIMFTTSLITLLIYYYRYNVLKVTSEHNRRFYGLLTIIFSVIGLGFAIYTGLGIYKTFIGVYVFPGYPLVMLIINTLMLSVGLTLFIDADLAIKRNNIPKPVYEHKGLHRVNTAGLVVWIVYSFNRVGALLLMPLLISRTHYPYSFPYYILMEIPAVLLICFLIYRDFAGKEWKRTFGIISNSCALVTAIACTIITRVTAGVANAEYIKSLSNVLLFERLVKFPGDTIINFGAALILPTCTAIFLIVDAIRDRIKLKKVQIK